MAAGDALLGQCGLHGRNGRGENVRLLEHLRGMWPIQRAEHCAVVEFHPFIQLNYRELVPARLGAPVFVLRSQTETGTRSDHMTLMALPVLLSLSAPSCVQCLIAVLELCHFYTAAVSQ